MHAIRPQPRPFTTRVSPVLRTCALLAVWWTAAPVHAADPADGVNAPAPPAGEAPHAAATDSPPPTIEPLATPALCEDATACAPGPLLAALVRLDQALLLTDPAQRDLDVATALHQLAALKDPRAVPLLVRVSDDPSVPIRLGALAALGTLSDDPRALQRLRQTLRSDAPGTDASAALPALMAWAARHPGERSVPCPAEATCVPDVELLTPLLAFSAAVDPQERAAAVTATAALHDPRAVAFLLRLSAAPSDVIRPAAIDGLAVHVADPAVSARLVELLRSGTTSDRLHAVQALAGSTDPALVDLLLAARRADPDAAVKAALEVELTRRAPAALAALLEEERAAALAAANAPGAFDTTMRGLLAGLAGASAAVGGAAASSVAADAITGDGTCYGVWGACAGGASAAAVTWFALGDRKLAPQDIALGLSTGVMGGFAGLLVPPTIGTQATQDGRHMVYAASGGALLGLTAGTVAALLTHPSAEDVGELDAGVATIDLLTAGALLTFGSGTDARPLWGALIGATLLGSGAAGVGAHFLTLDAPALGHTGLTAGVGLAAGLFAGGARAWFDRGSGPVQLTGTALLGTGLGAATGLTLGQLARVPTGSGMVYEAWATADGALAGLGTGMLIASLTDANPGYGFVGGAAGAVVGAASTALFPDGVALDTGDFMLQPLFVGFGLYHGGALAAAATQDARMVAAGAFLVPAVASAGLVFAAPHIRAGTGDVLMIASTMGMSAYVSAMALQSVSTRLPTPLPAWGFVLGTALAMDVGALGGVGLDLLPADHVGWRTTYVAAVAAGTTLVVSLPGALLASQSNGTVQVTDVLLGSTLVGAGIGLLTMPLIDFRIAPDLGLGQRPGDVEAPAVEAVPTVVSFNARGAEPAPLGFGVAGRF